MKKIEKEMQYEAPEAEILDLGGQLAVCALDNASTTEPITGGGDGSDWGLDGSK